MTCECDFDLYRLNIDSVAQPERSRSGECKKDVGGDPTFLLMSQLEKRLWTGQGSHYGKGREDVGQQVNIYARMFRCSETKMRETYS